MAIRTKGNVYLEINTATSGAAVWERVPGVFSNDGGGTTNDRIQATDFDTVGNSHEYIGGLSDENPLSFELHYEPGNEIQQQIRTSNAAGTEVELRMVFGSLTANAEAYTFDSLITSYGMPRGPIEGKLTVPFEAQPARAGAWGTPT